MLTQDPIGLAGGVNLYAYAGNNPISFSDPYGLCPTGGSLLKIFTCQSIEAATTFVGSVSGFVVGGGGGLLASAPTLGTAAPVTVPVGAAVGAGAGAVAGKLAGEWITNRLFSDNDGGGGGGGRKSSSAGKMQKEVERGQAPRSVDRVDKGRGPYEQDHVEFKSGDALNRDGTWKHGGRDLTNGETDWITGHGWDVPK